MFKINFSDRINAHISKYFPYKVDLTNHPHQNLWNRIPNELLMIIFSELNLASLGVCSRVCKRWRLILTEPNIWKPAIYREIAIGKDVWIKHFGPDAIDAEDCQNEFSSLPDDIVNIIKRSCQRMSRKVHAIRLMRVFKTIKGETFTTQYFLSMTLGNFTCRIPRNFQNCLPIKGHQIEKTCWFLFAKGFLEETDNRNIKDQEALVVKFAKETETPYEIPKGLIACLCFFSEFLKFQNHGAFKGIVTRCQEVDGRWGHLVVGFNAYKELLITCYSNGSLKRLGVLPVANLEVMKKKLEPKVTQISDLD